MKNPVKTYFEWEENKWQTVGIKRWEHQRNSGKFNFSLNFGLLLTVTNSVVLSFFDYFIFSGIRLDTILVRALLLLFIFSSIGFLIVWKINERKYQRYLEKKQSVLFLSKAQSHNFYGDNGELN